VALRPSMDAASAMRAALREALAHMKANVRGAAAGKDPEFLHQLRVGSRRLRAALRESRELWRKNDVRALRRELRRLSAAAGPARDWDVLHEKLPARLKARASSPRRAAQHALRGTLLKLELRLPRAKRDPGPPLAQFAREALDRMHRKLLERRRGTDWDDAERRHALRVRVRRLRYVAELLEAAFLGADARPLVASLKRLQDTLGELNDIEVARRLLRDLGAPASGSAHRERALLERLPSDWRAFAAAPRFWRVTP
jgi:triphosphatase